MYCVNCGNPLSPGLSYCSRCGTELKGRSEVRNTPALIALLIAITILGIGGLGVLFGGAVVMKKEAGLSNEVIGFFMFFTFIILGVSEVVLLKNLSRVLGTKETRTHHLPHHKQPLELQPPAATTFGQPIGSVTENTTRTLQYSERER